MHRTLVHLKLLQATVELDLCMCHVIAVCLFVCHYHIWKVCEYGMSAAALLPALKPYMEVLGVHRWLVLLQCWYSTFACTVHIVTDVHYI